MPTRSPVQPDARPDRGPALGRDLRWELVGETDPKLLAGAMLTTYNGALITWAMHGEGAVDKYVRSQLEFLLGAWLQRPKTHR
jgi:hypothetical protein